MSATDADSTRIAVTGLAGRFPGAPDVDAFWRNLADGRESVSALTERDLRESGPVPAEAADPRYVRAKGVLADADRYDAGFFGHTPREAELLDPQHRVFLECAWEALESAGVDPGSFGGRIGVFGGASLNSYLMFNLLGNRRVFESAGAYRALLAGDKDFLATRAAYAFGLTGPAVTVQTACSTSLTAVHLACQSLLAGECDLALAGGVSVSVPLTSGYPHEQGGILSAQGRCRPFDAAADGTVPGNGVGLVVLRRLADALAAGDRVDAVILGTAVNNDGSDKVGWTAPSVTGQAEVIAEALAVADVDPATIGYVEAHGTGTALGDPIEIAALTRAWREYTPATGYCAIGSVKSNVGHLDAAAGVTALIKAVLALREEAIPATAGFTAPNPELSLETTPFYVTGERRPWPRGGAPRRAAVSSFGIGGTNAHLILQEAPAAEPAPAPAADGPVPLPLPLSARSADALAAGAHRLADHLAAHPDTPLAEVAHTLAYRRKAFERRRTVLAATPADAVAALRRLAPADAVRAAENAPVALLFPGQGAQYPGMARGLYARHPAFAAAVDRCAELFAGHLGEDLRPLLFDGAAEGAGERLARTGTTQPALFTVGYALARLWEEFGVRPRAMAGHSVGEYVAACLAGVFSLPDAVRLVAVRGRLAEAMPPGAMLSVFLPEAEARALAADGPLEVAAVNSTGLSVVSGPEEDIAALQRRLTAEGTGCRRLRTSHAFHSASMDAAVEPLVAAVARVPREAPAVPFLSCVTGTWITAEQATSPAYWGRQLREPVLFAAALQELLADEDLVLLEAGPGRTLGDFARAHRSWRPGRTAPASLRHPGEEREDHEALLEALGGLWAAGVPVDWRPALGGQAGRGPALRLPGYAFQRQRYWVRPDSSPVGAGEEPQETAGGFWAPGWKRLPEPAARPAPAPGAADRELWAVLGADLPLGAALADLLAAEGHPVVRVEAGAALDHGPDGSWRVDPADREHLADLLKGLDADRPGPLRLVHLWSTGRAPGGEPDADALRAARRTGFDSLLALAQALGEPRRDGPVTLDVLCRGVHSVTGEEALQPENAVLLGACAVIPQEVPGVACRSVDVTGLDPYDPGPAPVRALRALLDRPVADRELALRGTHGWRREDDAVPLDAPQADGTGADGPYGGLPVRVRPGGVYLVTGGLGGVGLALAETLADAAERPVLGLLARSPFPAADEWDGWLAAHGADDPVSARIGRLRRLAGRGARVEVLRADVTDAAATAAAVAALRDRHGPLNGVVHAAGLPSRGMIAGKSAQDADEVLAAKTTGTLVLDAVCREDPLDFLLLCSSVTARLGGPGQSDYAAANAFLDAFAQWKRQHTGAPVTAIAWDTWRGVGMAAGLGTRLGTGPGGGGPAGHPLLRLVEDRDGRRTYRTTLDTGHWVLADHRLMGHGLLPGTTYLELVRAAVAEQAAGRVTELTEVLFSAPVIVPDGGSREVYTTVEPDGDRLRFTVRSRVAGPGGEPAWREHAGGRVVFHERGPATVRDLAGLRAEVGPAEVIDSEQEIRRRFGIDRIEHGGPLQFAFGPRWQCLRAIEAGERGLLATLRLDDAFLGDLADYPLHPALLDVAGAAARLRAPDVYYLPFSYGSLRIEAPLTGTVHCRVELKGPPGDGETLTCDTHVYDPEGRLLVAIGDFTIKRITDLGALHEQVRRAVADAAAGPDEAGPLRLLAEGMSEAEGRAAFARLLAAPALPAHLAVTRRPLPALLRLARSLTPERLAGELAGLAPPGGSHPRPDLDTPYTAPETDLQRAVAEVWQEVLGIDRVGLHDDFFALGGHSLSAVQIGAKLRQRFGADLELRDFFRAPTVAHTAVLLADGPAPGADAGSGGDDPIPVLDRHGGAADGPDATAEMAELSDAEVEAQLRALLAAEAAEADGAIEAHESDEAGGAAEADEQENPA
ncbi:SDR family NAD(P)-dependent oxidoreductase [Streptomyces sp. B1866]|uniref:type I polyketide synthase n=1 Tax=Streptomyces sp. B1866 TaxID=3075431 RepID=UPI00288F6AA3|nr:SDR family NAD(P)-dependent oxidoreductase [Streptomyces sp. B1866]MDT3395985.1 SDR family NAD(P)-dependent oxidoreductase [Streptomyces sp. B1866]